MSNSRSNSNKKKRIIKAMPILLGALGIIMFMKAEEFSVMMLKKGYNTTFKNTSDSIHEVFYNEVYKFAEKSHHVSNEIQIRIDDVKKQNKLEVLKASDTFLKVTDPEKDNSESQRWVEIPGTAVYTVDLSMSEIVTDKHNKFVIVRVPGPELSNIKIDYSNCKINLYDYKKQIFSPNGNYEKGADEAQQDYAEAYSELHERFYKDQRFYGSAENSARNLITAMVRNLNPNITDLSVEIEFI